MFCGCFVEMRVVLQIYVYKTTFLIIKNYPKGILKSLGEAHKKFNLIKSAKVSILGSLSIEKII